MKIVIRQDGSSVELSDLEAEQWIKRGLATAMPVAPSVVVEAKPTWGFNRTPEPIQTNEEK